MTPLSSGAPCAAKTGVPAKLRVLETGMPCAVYVELNFAGWFTGVPAKLRIELSITEPRQHAAWRRGSNA